MRTGKSKTFIIKSGQCSWGKCIFCGYGKIKGYEPALENIKNDLDKFFAALENDITQVKIFGSGSFLDEKQFPQKSRIYFLELCRKHKIKDVLFESRPEYITDKTLQDFKEFNFTVAIGLEVADNEILKKLKKGTIKENCQKAAETVHKNGGKVRTYLLVNPPYIKDIKKSLEESVTFALKHSDSIVLINLYPHVNAEMIDLYLNLEWRPLDKDQFKKMTEIWKDNKKIEPDFETFIFTPK
ncbi:MAG: radical SAM protein, partial [archaeon]|nr:radical SAM protein [archaeon]